jgi:hypothetical protein
MTDFRSKATGYADRQAAYIRNLADQVEERRRAAEGRGELFTAVTADQLERKLKRSNSPMIVFQSWSGSAPVGGALTYSVGVNNPDPVDHYSLFVHLFVGPANVAPDVSEAVTAVDERFARLTEPAFAGLVVKAGTTEQLDFSIPIPAVESTNYLGNSILMQSTWHDPAVYLDRSLFVFTVG